MISTEPVTEAFCLVYSLEFCWVMIITFSSLCRGLNRRIRLGLSETEELVCFGDLKSKMVWWVPCQVLNCSNTRARSYNPKLVMVHRTGERWRERCDRCQFLRWYPRECLSRRLLFQPRCSSVTPSFFFLHILFLCGGALPSSGWKAAASDVWLEHHLLQKVKIRVCWFTGMNLHLPK